MLEKVAILFQGDFQLEKSPLLKRYFKRWSDGGTWVCKVQTEIPEKARHRTTHMCRPENIGT
ncbi:MAG: hypothetical protein HY795_10805 [Desulfovibrio sp.]|nr:hypothetical protein [Desulfovibrio sp.]